MNTADSTLDNILIDASRATRQRWDARYGEGVLPWDTQITPPEVVDFWRQARLAPQGLAVDLGCGPGTNVRYLATLGLAVIGVEIASAPLIMARQRLARFAPEAMARAYLLCADVSRLPFHGLNANYVLDIGCFHSLPRSLRPGYANSVIANLAPGGFYHLYAFDTDLAIPEPPSGPVGVDEGEIAQSFAPHLQIVEEVVARPDRRPCRWYLLQRPT
jgi:SAM-dependent methyltransferase